MAKADCRDASDAAALCAAVVRLCAAAFSDALAAWALASAAAACSLTNATEASISSPSCGKAPKKASARSANTAGAFCRFGGVGSFLITGAGIRSTPLLK